MMGKRGEQWTLFYQFRLDERVPKDHLPRAHGWLCDNGARYDRFICKTVRQARLKYAEPRSHVTFQMNPPVKQD